MTKNILQICVAPNETDLIPVPGNAFCKEAFTLHVVKPITSITMTFT